MLVLPRRALSPLKEWPPQEDIECFPLRPGADALETVYDVDAHLVMYSIDGEDVLPRLAKKYPQALRGLESSAGDILLHWVVLDIDVPDHKHQTFETTQPSWWISQLAAIKTSPEACVAGWYHTRGGYHLVWALDPPLPPKAWEKGVAGLRARLRKDGIQINEECKDWTRLMRLPRVTREDDGQVQDRHRSLDSIGWLDLSVPDQKLHLISTPTKQEASKAPQGSPDDWSLVRVTNAQLRDQLKRGAPISNTPSRRLPGEQGRDTQILSIAGSLVRSMVRPDPEVVVRLMLPSVVASRRDEPQQIGDEDTLRDRVRTIVEKDLQARADRGESPPPPPDDPFDGLEAQVEDQSLIPLLATDDAKYYVWDSARRGYYGPVNEKLAIVWLIESDPINAGSYSEDGKRILAPTLLQRQGCGRIARIVHAPDARITTYDKDTLTLSVAPEPSVSEMSVVRPDGSVFRGPGYDDVTHTVVSRDALLLDDVPGDVDASRGVLVGLLRDFPFKAEADRGVALSLLVTAVLRPWVDDVVPLHLLHGNRPGTGKGLIADLAAILATGTDGSPLRFEGDRELAKKTTAALAGGARLILWDEIPPGTELRSKYVDATITSPHYFDRLLGSSKAFSCINRITWVAAGNNVGLGSKDAFRRTLVCRLETSLEDPEERNDFTIPGGAGGLKDHVRAYRGEIVQAILTLMRVFLERGSPQPEGTLGGFETWCRTVRALVVHHFGGDADPLGHRSERKASRAFTREGTLVRILQIVWSGQDKFKQGWSPQDLVTWTAKTSEETRGIVEMIDEVTDGAEDRARVTKLGLLLSSVIDTPIMVDLMTTVRLRRLPHTRTGTRYHLVEILPEMPAPF